MPGVALWHVSWVNKDDSIDWQAYFHARNRIVAGLLHSNAPRGGRLLRHSRRVDLKHLMMMQYYPAALRAMALRDVLSGPEHMRRNLATAMPEARALAAEAKFRNPALAVRAIDLTGVKVGDDGEVDADAIKAKLKTLSDAEPYLVDDGTKPAPKADPSQGGGGGNDDGTSVSAGRDMYTAKHGKKSA